MVRPKVLIEAYECSPYRSHAPGAAWQIITRLSEHFDIWVITEESQYGSEIRAFMNEKHPNSSSLKFIFIKRISANSLGWRRSVLPYKQVKQYDWWLKKSYNYALQLHAEIGFNISHHLRGNSFRTPGYLWKLPIPFVLGPIGGTYGIPRQLIRSMNIKAQCVYQLRDLITQLQLHYSPNVRSALTRAKIVFAQTMADQNNLRRVFGIESKLLHEQAADEDQQVTQNRRSTKYLSVAWLGRCIEGKGVSLLLRGLAKARHRNHIILHLVGDGSSKRSWQSLAHKLGISEQCRWHGWIPQNDALEVLSNCHVLAFPSLLEGTPATIMQAIGLGMPVICLQHCGYADIIDESCGFPIPVDHPKRVMQMFAQAIDKLVDSPKLCEQMSYSALARAKEYSWHVITKKITDAYIELLECTSSSVSNSRNPSSIP